MEKKPHILCVDDDDKIRELLKVFLTKNNFRVSIAGNANQAKNLVKLFIFDIIVLDIMMPEISGIEFLETFRSSNNNTPVIMLTATSQLKIKTESYLIGCDDYLSKPFEPTELVLRIKKLLNPRINNIKSQKKHFFGDFIYEFQTKQLFKNNENIKLTTNEEYLIEMLVSNINKVISRELIAKKLNLDSNLRSVDVLITRLRKKITTSTNISFLKTVRGKGYMLVSEYE
jgi:two-component system phosphate regulon response regulator OmpR|tara:strand:+ start:167 stop:853 length:687 start_codon:yes stop_codon:yes gene_type:complete